MGSFELDSLLFISDCDDNDFPSATSNGDVGLVGASESKSFNVPLTFMADQLTANSKESSSLESTHENSSSIKKPSKGIRHTIKSALVKVFSLRSGKGIK